jgi:hypothetical protein
MWPDLSVFGYSSQWPYDVRRDSMRHILCLGTRQDAAHGSGSKTVALEED